MSCFFKREDRPPFGCQGEGAPWTKSNISQLQKAFANTIQQYELVEMFYKEFGGSSAYEIIKENPPTLPLSLVGYTHERSPRTNSNSSV